MRYFTLFVYSLFLVSCISNKETDSFVSEESVDTISATAKPILVYTKYNLPLPVDFYRFLKKQDSPSVNVNTLNPPINIERYITNKKKGINFGIYTSDLAYCIVFEKNQESINYYNVTKDLADNLHIAKGYTMEIVERLNNNINNNDSLHNIASKSYWSACNYLEANDEVNILPLIVAGAWIESIYLAIISIDAKTPPPYFLKRLTDEKESLENLIQYLLDVIMDSNTFEINLDIQEVGTKLQGIREIYKKVPENDTLSLSQFNELKNEISNVRNYYIE